MGKFTDALKQFLAQEKPALELEKAPSIFAVKDGKFDVAATLENEEFYEATDEERGLSFSECAQQNAPKKQVSACIVTGVPLLRETAKINGIEVSYAGVSEPLRLTVGIYYGERVADNTLARELANVLYTIQQTGKVPLTLEWEAARKTLAEMMADTSPEGVAKLALLKARLAWNHKKKIVEPIRARPYLPPALPIVAAPSPLVASRSHLVCVLVYASDGVNTAKRFYEHAHAVMRSLPLTIVTIGARPGARTIDVWRKRMDRAQVAVLFSTTGLWAHPLVESADPFAKGRRDQGTSPWLYRQSATNAIRLLIVPTVPCIVPAPYNILVPAHPGARSSDEELIDAVQLLAQLAGKQGTFEGACTAKSGQIGCEGYRGSCAEPGEVGECGRIVPGLSGDPEW